MIVFAYVIPIIACLLLHFEFDYEGKWTTYMWLIIIGEGVVGLLHWFFYRYQTSSSEYLGSLVEDIVYEEGWTELEEVTETRRDSKGDSYTVKRIEEKYHSEKYYFHTTRGSTIKTNYSFYSYVRGLWLVPEHRLTWTGSDIKGGIRYGSKYKRIDLGASEYENPDKWVPVTEKGSYTNKVKASNSIFKFETISSSVAYETGLYDYPPISGHDAKCIISDGIDVPPYVDDLFRKFNARYASEVQMRLYILLFDAAKGISISELQRAYWQGGNKNEFTVCIGLNDQKEVEWARAFSWADEQLLEVDTARWLMDNRNLDWECFYNWLRAHIIVWKRKEFSDFSYIRVTPPLWQILTTIVLSAIVNALLLYIVIN